MNSHTLVLTPWMSPHRVVPWTTAVCLLHTGKAKVLSEYDEVIRSPSVEMNLPSVIWLVKPVNAFKKGVKFSRINVMTRDNFTCQYCGKKLPMKDLNYDHVVPRRLGGRTVWENIATSCVACNDRKGGRTPEQAKMRLLRKPARPKTLPMTRPILPRHSIPESWLPYLGGGALEAFA